MSSAAKHDLRQYGYSRDKRGDCRQVVIALIVTPEGFPLSYEVLAGNTADSTTLSEFLDRIEQRYGRANRIWVMDRGIPTEDSLAKMRSHGRVVPGGHAQGAADAGSSRPSCGQPWARVREGVQVKRLATEEDVYVLAQSDARIDKERGMRRKRLRRYVDRLQALQGQSAHARPVADEARRGQARGRARRQPGAGDDAPRPATKTASLEFRLDRARLRQVRRREGPLPAAHQPHRAATPNSCGRSTSSSPRSSRPSRSSSTTWRCGRSSTTASSASRRTSSWPSSPTACRSRSRPTSGALAHGITPREVIAKFKTMQMVDVHLPTTDGRELVLSRYTQPEPEHRMLAGPLAAEAARAAAAEDHPHKHASITPDRNGRVVETFEPRAESNQALSRAVGPQLRKMG